MKELDLTKGERRKKGSDNGGCALFLNLDFWRGCDRKTDSLADTEKVER